MWMTVLRKNSRTDRQKGRQMNGWTVKQRQTDVKMDEQTDR